MDNFCSLKKAATSLQLSFLSPAKINLFFRVLYKREDGFHEIASLYQAINLYDTLTISLGVQDSFTCSDPTLLMNQDNLVIKALSLFRKKTGKTAPIQIHLEKKIPMQAGLGGGSSNAATTLFALSRLFEIRISDQELALLGAGLGSDVPFFFSSGTAYCTGRGERLENVPSLSLPDLWIVKPKVGLSTPLVYHSCNPALLESRDPRAYTKNLCLYNDLEEAAFQLEPSLRELKKKLLQMGARDVVLCGSGTAFFCTGLENLESLPNVAFFSVRPIQKKEQEWYN